MWKTNAMWEVWKVSAVFACWILPRWENDKMLFHVCFQKGLDHLLNQWLKGCVLVALCFCILCACVWVSKSIHANVVLNVNFWSVLFTLVVSVEVPFACNIVRKCCNQPHLLCLLSSPFYLHPLCPLFIIKPQLSIWTLYTLTFTQN